jgi:hypothetical protein
MYSRWGRWILVISAVAFSFFLIGRSCDRHDPSVDPNNQAGVASLERVPTKSGRPKEALSERPLESAEREKSRQSYGDAIPSTSDRSTDEIDGRWELKTITGTTLDLMLIRGRGTLTERDSGGKLVTEQTVLADRVNEQILVLGLNAQITEGDKEKAHPSMLLFSRRGDSFQILWRYADANSGWSPLELISHKPF